MSLKFTELKSVIAYRSILSPCHTKINIFSLNLHNFRSYMFLILGLSIHILNKGAPYRILYERRQIMLIIVPI